MEAMKRCSRCGMVKARASFNRSRRRADGLQIYCRDCTAEINHMSYERRLGRTVPRKPRKIYGSARGGWLRSLKAGKPCTDCGRVFEPQVMQWDHLPQFEKIGDISEAFWGRTDDEVLRELAKCELVCTNCHIVRTFQRNGWDKRSLQEIDAPYGKTWTRVAA